MTFIIDVRGGGPSSGYISAGFFGGMFSDYRNMHSFIQTSRSGMTIGRVALLWVNHKVMSQEIG